MATPGHDGLPAIHVPRLSEIDVGTSSSATADYQAVYDWDNTTQRISRITGPGLPAYGVLYSYLADTSLVETITYKTTSTGSAVGSVTRSYESSRDLLASVENKWPTSTSVSKYALYVNDAVGRRTSCVYTGSAFTGGSGDHNDVWSYDDRNELTGSARFGVAGNPDTADHAGDRGYVYDPIGNRSNSTEGTSATLYYCANGLNQYTSDDTST